MNISKNKKSILYGKKIKDALLQLLKDGKRLEEISVSMLCKQANVNRSTFYYRYAIPSDVLTEIKNDFLKESEICLKKLAARDTDSLGQLLNLIKMNSDLFSVLVNKNIDDSLLNSLIQQSLRNMTYIDSLFIDKSELIYIHSYFIGGSKEIMFNWIKNGFIESADEIKEVLLNLNDAFIHYYLKKKKLI